MAIERTARVSSAKDVLGIRKLDGGHGGVQRGVVVGDLAHGLHALAECQHLGALARTQAADGRAGFLLGPFEAVAG